MLDRLRSHIEFGNRYTGVECISINGKEAFIGIKVKRKKNLLEIEESFQCGHLDSITDKLSKSVNFFLVINNDNVIAKWMISNNTDHHKLVYQAFPNININDFFYEVIQYDNSCLVSICRKDDVFQLIDSFRNSGLFVYNFSLGNSLLGGISGFIEGDNCYTSNARISFNDQKINKVEFVENSEVRSYNVNSLKVSSHELLSFSAAIQPLIGLHELSDNAHNEKVELRSDFRHRRVFQLGLKSALIFFFGLLLFNFIGFSHYYDKAEDLNKMSSLNQTSKERLLLLNELVEKKEKMVNDLQFENRSNSALIINNIISSLPTSILLTELKHQPLLKKVKPGQTIELDRHVITLRGDSNNNLEFSNWIVSLEAQPWVQQIDILDFGTLNKGVSTFEIKLKLNNDS